MTDTGPSASPLYGAERGQVTARKYRASATRTCQCLSRILPGSDLIPCHPTSRPMLLAIDTLYGLLVAISPTREGPLPRCCAPRP